MYDTLLWDLDGTLTDSQPGIYNSVFYSLDSLKLPHPEPEIMIKFIGPPLLESYEKYCGLTGERGWEALRLYREYFNTKGYLENSVYPGIPEALAKLREAGFSMSVATSKPEEYARKICDHFGISEYFDFIGGASKDETRNNKNQVIEYVLEELGNPEMSGVLMIGDREHDVQGAHINGLDCMGVLYGYGNEEELREAGAEVIVGTPGDIVTFLTMPTAGALLPPTPGSNKD